MLKALLEKAAEAVAWRLPRRVVYHAVIRAWAHGTTGKYGNTVAPSLTCDDAVRRWEGRQ